MDLPTAVVLAVALALALAPARAEELWRDDLSSRINIGVKASGFDKVWLECHADLMDVTVQMAEDFKGVIYTRGTFYSRDPACFLDPSGGRRFRLKMPLDDCKIEHDDGVYRATLIVQHDKELIMPGDGAFALQCDSKSNAKKVMSSISLADPDPSGKDVPTHLRSTVTGVNSVIFTPSDIRPKKAQRAPTQEL